MVTRQQRPIVGFFCNPQFLWDLTSQNGFKKPDKAHEDSVSYERDIKPFLNGTCYIVQHVETDWPLSLDW